jgi:hypothetical protein
MNFNVPVTLYALRPRRTLRAALRNPAHEMPNRFAGVANPLPCTLAQVFAWSLEAGYGAVRDQATYLTLLPGEQAELRRYLRQRLLLLSRLVKPVAGGGVVPRTFVKLLDSSEKADASFILGGLACRLAHERWFMQRGVTVRRFWHLSVYEKHAARWISYGAGPGKSRPDFLVQDSLGQWYPAEAKGSFDAIDWEPIQKGLRQAAQLKSITFTDASTSASTTQPINEFSCVMGHLSQTGELMASLVDPVADAGQPLALELIPALADANALLGALHAYRTWEQRAGRGSWTSAFDVKGYEVRAVGREPLFGKRLAIGIPTMLLQSERQLQAVMWVVGLFSKALQDFFAHPKEGSAAFVRRALAASLTARAGDASGSDPLAGDAELRELVSRMVAVVVHQFTLLADDPPPDADGATPTWHSEMARLTTMPLMLAGNHAASLQDWLGVVERLVDNARQSHRLQLRLQVPSSAPDLSAAMSLHGLLVIHGDAPRSGLAVTRHSKL